MVSLNHLIARMRKFSWRNESICVYIRGCNALAMPPLSHCIDASASPCVANSSDGAC